MKLYALATICLIIVLFGFGTAKVEVETEQPKPSLTSTETDTRFKLVYSTVGMGSNFMSCQPVFEVKGSQFIYMNNQTSGYTNGQWLENDTLLTGNFRKTAADSIIDLLQPISVADSFFCNPAVSSGLIHTLVVTHGKFHRKITLMNTSEKNCWGVVQLLNAFIPNDQPQLPMIFSEQFD